MVSIVTCIDALLLTFPSYSSRRTRVCSKVQDVRHQGSLNDMRGSIDEQWKDQLTPGSRLIMEPASMLSKLKKQDEGKSGIDFSIQVLQKFLLRDVEKRDKNLPDNMESFPAIFF